MYNYDNLPAPWRLAFDLAWESFTRESLPIAAVLVDVAGVVVSTGRNQMREKVYKNRAIAHAEMAALMDITYDDHLNIRQYTLYTTTEPCPMCLGTIVMSNVRNVRIAMADPWAGAAGMCEYPYIASKKMNLTFEEGVTTLLSVVLTAYRELELSKNGLNPVAERLKLHQPQGFAMGEALYAQGTLRALAAQGGDFRQAFDIIVSQEKQGA